MPGTPRRQPQCGARSGRGVDHEDGRRATALGPRFLERPSAWRDPRVITARSSTLLASAQSDARARPPARQQAARELDRLDLSPRSFRLSSQCCSGAGPIPARRSPTRVDERGRNRCRRPSCWQERMRVTRMRPPPTGRRRRLPASFFERHSQGLSRWYERDAECVAIGRQTPSRIAGDHAIAIREEPARLGGRQRRVAARDFLL